MKKSFLGSLIIHAMIFIFLTIKPTSQKPPVEVIKNTIEINLVEYKTEQQVVEQAQDNEEVPTESKYLSSHNQKVKKETSSPNHLSMEDLTPKPSYGHPDIKDVGDNPEGEVKSLVQAAEYLRQNLGEKIEDVEEGEETLVSSREFVYFSFYMRIKERLEQVWQPSVRAKINQLLKQGKHVLHTDRKTKLLIVLNAQGSLTKVQILHNSGVQDLDQEAVNAFKEAEPFPNPPKGMIEADGTIKIRWDFIVDN